MTRDLEQVKRALGAVQGAGATSLRDAVQLALAIRQSADARTVVIVFSDGADTSSWLRDADVVESARRSGVVSGRIFSASSADDLGRLFTSALDDMRGRYVITFAPRSPTPCAVTRASCIQLPHSRFLPGQQSRTARPVCIYHGPRGDREYSSTMAPVSTAARRSERDPVHLAGSILGANRHVCAFFRSHDDHYRILLPFIKEGFERGDKAVHVVDPKRRGDHVSRLAAAGIDPEAAQRSEQLELREWSEAHLLDGVFDQDRTVQLMGDIRRRSAEQGFPNTRFVTHMEWAVETDTAVDTLLEYEARANLQPLETPVVCAYDLTRFRGDVVVDIMRTHPMIIVGGVLQENPFFVEPEVFLRELHQRRARPSR